MPTYVCHLPTGRYSVDQKAQIAAAITKRHSEATGAPTFFVQVEIDDTPVDRYLGGQLTQDHIWVRGDIRAGRTEEQRTRMMLGMMRDISEITGLIEDNIWIYVNNLNPTDMVEYGHVLPQPLQEQQWFDELPERLQKYLKGLGLKKETFTL